ncbi:MAG: ABC transporter ATP-binding protein [Lachnospiraceae bacterium]|nr:ABC transporter ATP-binding protein [Lachnospiraceae bacterium]
MVEAKMVGKRYLRKQAVKDMNLVLEDGKIYALLGPNGSGKTTFMKMVAGLVKPTSGSLQYNNENIGVESKKRVAYMSTEPFFYSYMTVGHVGKYFADFFEDFSMERYEELIARMDLKMTDKAKELSSGLAAKLKIAATLARDAQLYMLDEPLNGIDIIARESVIQTIVEAATEGKTIVVSSHLVDELEPIVDNVVFMKQGTVVIEGDAEAVRTERGKSIVDLYKEVYAE